MSLLVLASLATGFVLGAGTAKAVAKKKADPAVWKPSAMRQLEKLQPTEAQRERFEEILDKTASQLGAVRTEAASRAAEIVAGGIADLEKEMTAEQRQTFARIKPKSADVAQMK